MKLAADSSFGLTPATESTSFVGTGARENIVAMICKLAAYIGILALAAFLILFEVQVDFEFSLPRECKQADPAHEARYAACFAQRDKEIHAAAFGTIDNPDVQKLYISTNREKARAACRGQFPERVITVGEPFRFNLIDLRFRF